MSANSGCDAPRDVRRFARASVLLGALFGSLGLAATAAVEPEGPAARILAEPAEMSPRAVAGLLLDIANPGGHLVAVGERGNIVSSADGQHWSQSGVPARSTLTALAFADAKTGWAVGHDEIILKTIDGGLSWQLQRFQPRSGKVLLDVMFFDPLRGLAVGTFGTALSTVDGGVTWKALTGSVLEQEGLHLNAVVCLGDGSALAAGENGALFLSADGETWERIASPYSGTLFGAVRRGARGALIFGLRGNAFVSADVRAGHWAKLDLATTQPLFGGQTSASGISTLVGADGLVRQVNADDSVHALEGNGAVSATLSGVVSSPYGLFAVGEKGISQLRGAPPARVEAGRP